MISGLGISSEHQLFAPQHAQCVQQLSVMGSAEVGAKVTPSMSTVSWNSIPTIVTGSVHAPTASALDFVGSRRDPGARSKHRAA